MPEPTPEIRYARSGDVHIAYSVSGDGPIDLVMVEGFLTNLSVMWEEPSYRDWIRRLGTFARVIRFDKRGMGLSDRVEAGTLEDRMDDVRAVMDAVGSERAAVYGESEGGPLSMLFAATYPQRTLALILCGSEVKEEKTDDWPWGEQTRAEFDEYIRTVPDRWHDIGFRTEVFAPSVTGASAERIYEWSKRLVRASASPSAGIAFMRVGFGIDVRDVCPTITTPTLIIHRVGDRVCHVENARYLARTIPTAKYVELQGDDHVEWGSPAYAAEIVDEMREFLTGTREPAEPERALMTVLFTDIVGSTEQAVAVGDAQWASIVERHHDAVRAELQRYRGREIDTAGDGFFASFDGPARAIRCADAIRTAVAALGLDIRAGVHTGECEIVGDSLRGIAVHTGARVAAQATAGEILVSSTVRDLVAGSGIEFTDRGFVALKGLPEQRQLYAVSRVGD